MSKYVETQKCKQETAFSASLKTLTTNYSLSILDSFVKLQVDKYLTLSDYFQVPP